MPPSKIRQSSNNFGEPNLDLSFPNGAIAQLVARLHGMQEVTSSTLVSSTSLRSYELRLAGQPNGRDCQAEIVRAKAARRSSWGENSEPLFIQSEGGLSKQTHANSYHPKKMYYTYIIKSVSHSSQSHIGFTSNLKQRLIDHNSGKSPHANKFKPGQLDFYCAFASQEKAINFEKYLKSESGRSFAKKHDCHIKICFYKSSRANLS